jgi:dUTP pyrophosphatase
MKCKFGDEYIPKRATPGSAGYDFFSPVKREIMPIEVKAVDEFQYIDTGVYLEDGDLAEDEVLLILPRSSFGMKYGFYLANGVGVIDSDYRDTIKVYFNTEKSILTLNKGDRFLQGIVVKTGTIGGKKRAEEDTVRKKRRGGYGSTDKDGEANDS